MIKEAKGYREDERMNERERKRGRGKRKQIMVKEGEGRKEEKETKEGKRKGVFPSKYFGCHSAQNSVKSMLYLIEKKHSQCRFFFFFLGWKERREGMGIKREKGKRTICIQSFMGESLWPIPLCAIHIGISVKSVYTHV